MLLAEWTAHPARRRPRDIALVACVVCLTAAAVLGGLGSPFLALLAVVVLLVAVAPFLFPTRYRLTDEGLEERRLGRRRARPWSELRRLEVGPGAALVSPFARRSWLDRHRGLLLLLDGADRERVVALLRERVEQRGAPS